MSSEVFLVLDFDSICRFCLEHQVTLSNIYTDNENNALVEQILNVTTIKVTKDENTPKKICHRCRYKIELFQEFKSLALSSQQTLQNNLTLEIYNHSRKHSVSEDHAYFNDSNITHNSDVDTDNIEQVQPVHNINIVEVETSDQISTNTLEDSLHGQHYEQGINTNYYNLNFAEKNNQCLICLEKYSNKDLLNIHIQKHVHGTDLTPYYLVKNTNLFCKPCNKFFRHRFTFLVHQREHLNIKPFVCHYNDCNYSFYSNSALKQHLPIHSEKTFVCSKCGIGFKRKSDMKAHETIHLNSDINTCALCGVICKNRLTFAAHIRKHKITPKFKCTHCVKQYYSHSELNRHILSHAKLKMFKCENCSRSYYSRSALQRHLKMCSELITD